MKRTLTYDDKQAAFTLAGDHRHVHAAAIATGLMTPGGTAPKGQVTPGSKSVGAGPESEELLDQEAASSFKTAGILMCIVPERPDVQYSARIIMTDMAKPT